MGHVVAYLQNPGFHYPAKLHDQLLKKVAAAADAVENVEDTAFGRATENEFLVAASGCKTPLENRLKAKRSSYVHSLLT